MRSVSSVCEVIGVRVSSSVHLLWGRGREQPHHRKGFVNGRIPPAQPYPIARARCARYLQRCLLRPARQSRPSGHIVVSTPPPEVAYRVRSSRRRLARKLLESIYRGVNGWQDGWAARECPYPLVKTLSSDVLPHAPSPLFDTCQQLHVDRLPKSPASKTWPYSKTSLRWTVFDPPHSDGIVRQLYRDGLRWSEVGVSPALLRLASDVGSRRRRPG
jgi:hypothetical protein